MTLRIEWVDWVGRKRREVAAEEPLSIQANIAALSQRLWKAEQQLEQVRRACDKWADGSHNPPLGYINAIRNILDGGDA